MPTKPKNVLAITRWYSGLFSQRNPLVTPIAIQGMHVIQRFDTLIDGLNMEVSPRNTLERRPGFTKACSATINAPLNFFSFRQTNATPITLVDTAGAVSQFTSSTISPLFSKTTGTVTRFAQVANTLYMCDSADLKKWNGATVTTWGIATPSVTPTATPVAGALSPQSGYQYVYSFKNSSTGHVSTTSAASTSTGAQTSKNFTVQGTGSADGQVDKIEIYRTADGGAVFYFLADISNPGNTTWTYTDSTADSGLNELIVGPINHVNDPPPVGLSNTIFHMGRLWGSTANTVYFSGGPDTTVGSGQEAWPPANVFVFPETVNAFASTSSGLLVFTTGDTYIISGLDSASFYAQKFLSNFGTATQDCVTQDGDLVYVFTTSRQLFSISGQLEEVGFDIGDKLAAFNPSVTFLTLHRSGIDGGLFIGDGSSQFYRFSIAKNCWSPAANVVNGIGAIKSIYTATGVQQLIVGRPSNGSFILFRDLNSWSDDGTAYSAYATIGNIVLGEIGSTAPLTAILVEQKAVGTVAQVSILANEISGNFVTIPTTEARPEPPMLPSSKTVTAVRYYLNSALSPVPREIHHGQFKITFPIQNAHSELFTVGLMS